jgi:hypothetical protein
MLHLEKLTLFGLEEGSFLHIFSEFQELQTRSQGLDFYRRKMPYFYTYTKTTTFLQRH